MRGLQSDTSPGQAYGQQLVGLDQARDACQPQATRPIPASRHARFALFALLAVSDLSFNVAPLP